MVTPVSVHEGQLTRLVALSPGDGRMTALVRRVCAQALSLPPLPAEVAVDGPESETETTVAEFAEQFSVDVSTIADDQRVAPVEDFGGQHFRCCRCDVHRRLCAPGTSRIASAGRRFGVSRLGERTDLVGARRSIRRSVQRVLAGGGPDAFFGSGDIRAGPAARRSAAQLPAVQVVARERRTRCRGSETLYDDIERFETSALLDDRAKAALRYTDALIWSPAHLVADDVAGVRSRFSEAEAVEITFDIMRNASNKVAVALGADAARVEHGTERYLIGADGQTVFG